MITHTLGAILAGGSSTRMGREKGALTLRGTSFLNRIHETMTQVFGEVIVCGGSAVPPGGVLIPDARPGEGPVGGLLSALRVAGGRPVFVIALDTPLVTVEIIRSIVEPQAEGCAVRIAAVAGEDQPLVGVYGPGVAPVARARLEAGRRSMLGVVDDVDDVTRVATDRDSLINVNTTQDYEELIERYGL